jgi:antitoxin CcdA
MHNLDMVVTRHRKNVTVSVREDLIKAAKAFGLNTSHAAEEGLEPAVRKARGEAWLSKNASAIAAHNDYIEAHGIPFPALGNDA